MKLPAGLEITWLGHSTVLVKTPGGKRILIDPWTQGNPACPPEWKEYAEADLILLTHGHDDHIDDAVRVATLSGCPIVAVAELGWYLHKKGGVPWERFGEPMNKGGTQRFDDLGISVTMVHGDHLWSAMDGENFYVAAESVGYMVTLLDGGFTFYHAGDTAVFGDMALLSEIYRPTLAMLPIGDHFTMGPREAAYAARLMKSVEAIMPIHYGTFPTLTGTPEALRKECDAIGVKTPLLVFERGETKGA